MASPDANVSRLGQINKANDVRALMLKLFGGEVLKTFHNKTMMLERHFVQTINAGKSAQFPVIGTTVAAYHVPGTLILGDTIAHNEVILTIDELLLASVFIANIDEAMNHYEVRSRYSDELGTALALRFDNNVIMTALAAARAVAANANLIVSDKFRITGVGAAADIAEKATALGGALFDAAVRLDTLNAPEERWAAFRPLDYYCLAQSTTLINTLYGGKGAISDGTIFKIAGINIEKSNQVPSTNMTSTDTYHGVDCTKTVGLVWCRDCVGTLKLMDVALEQDYQIERQGTLMVAKYAMGHGALYGNFAIEIKLNSLSN